MEQFGSKKNILEYLNRADAALEDGDILTAAGYVRRVLRFSPKNREANLLSAEIFESVGQPMSAIQVYFDMIKNGDTTEAAERIVENLTRMGDVSAARKFAQRYGIKIDLAQIFSDNFIDGFSDDDDENGIPTDEILDSLQEYKPKFRLLVKDDEIQREEKEGDADLDALKRKLFEEYMAADKDENGGVSRKFKLIYPLSKSVCEQIIQQSVGLFTTGEFSAAEKLLNKIPPQNGEYYYIALKHKTICYAAQSNYIKMRQTAELALQGLPNDFIVRCYFFTALKYTGDKAGAEKLYEQLKLHKPVTIEEKTGLLSVFIEQNEHAEVMKLSYDILQEMPYVESVWMTYMAAQFNVGDKSGALYSLAQMHKVYPDAAEITVLLHYLKNNNLERINYSGFGVPQLLTISNDEFADFVENPKNEVVAAKLKIALSSFTGDTLKAFLDEIAKTDSKAVEHIAENALMELAVSKASKYMLTVYLLRKNPRRKIAFVNQLEYASFKLDIPPLWSKIPLSLRHGLLDAVSIMAVSDGANINYIWRQANRYIAVLAVAADNKAAQKLKKQLSAQKDLTLISRAAAQRMFAENGGGVKQSAAMYAPQFMDYVNLLKDFEEYGKI